MKQKKNNLDLLLLAILLTTVFLGTTLIIVIPTKKITCYQTVTEKKGFTEQKGEWIDKQYLYEDCESKRLLYGINWISEPYDCIKQICANHEQYCVEKNFWGNCVRWKERCIKYECTLYKRTCNYEIENKDDVRGTFVIEGWKGTNTQKKELVKTIKIWVSARSKVRIQWKFTYTDPYESYCHYKPKDIPFKKECKTKVGTKREWEVKDIIVYKNVPVEKPYTKIVNWLFGSC